ncbi:MAG TPA: AEC family transporter [Candidatus Brocadiia bacterium]|nr:AEC family transporter [Candidatus Brocadiia bacterium]
MTPTFHVIETVLAFSAVITLSALLKRFSVASESDAPLFARILTRLVVPALVFRQLATHPLQARQLVMVGAMIAASLVSLALAWLAGRALRLDRARLGALMIVSTFGSSSLLGYPMIEFSFPNDAEAMTDAVLVSELGVGLPIFTICPLVAMLCGARQDRTRSWTSIAVEYVRSPVFIAVALGLVAAPLRPDAGNPVIAVVSQALYMLEGAVTLLAGLTLGLQLKHSSLKGVWILLIVSSVIQMGIEPFVAVSLGHLGGLSGERLQVLALISSMPAAVLGPVFATRYDCAGETASTLAFAHIVLGAVVIPGVFSLIG